MKQVYQIMGKDCVVLAVQEGGERNHAVRLEQESVIWMKDLVVMYTMEGS